MANLFNILEQYDESIHPRLPNLTPRLQSLAQWMLGQTVRCTHPALLAWDIPGAYRDCPDCEGLCDIIDPQWAPLLRVLTAPCSRCNGDGWRDWGEGRSECYVCRGTGKEVNPVWQQLRAHGIDGALNGAVSLAVTTMSDAVQGAYWHQLGCSLEDIAAVSALEVVTQEVRK